MHIPCVPERRWTACHAACPHNQHTLQQTLHRQEVREYKALVDSLPCAQAIQVSKLLQSLLQVSLAAERTLSRGRLTCKYRYTGTLLHSTWA